RPAPIVAAPGMFVERVRRTEDLAGVVVGAAAPNHARPGRTTDVNAAGRAWGGSVAHQLRGYDGGVAHAARIKVARAVGAARAGEAGIAPRAGDTATVDIGLGGVGDLVRALRRRHGDLERGRVGGDSVHHDRGGVRARGDARNREVDAARAPRDAERI